MTTVISATLLSSTITINVVLFSCYLVHSIFAHMSSFSDHFRAAALKNRFFFFLIVSAVPLFAEGIYRKCTNGQ